MGWGTGPASTGNGGVTLLQSHEPHPAMTVRVKEGHWKSKLEAVADDVEFEMEMAARR